MATGTAVCLRLEPQAERATPGQFARVDRLLVASLATAGHELSRSQLARAFADGTVQVAGISIKPSMRIDRAVDVELRLPEVTALECAFAEDLPLAVVYEDEAVLVVDKAAGMVVHAGPGHSSGTLVNAVLHHLGQQADAMPRLEGNGVDRPGIVHRIDRATSGLLVIAKSLAAQRTLAAQFKAHTVARRYWALVEGVPSWSKKKIETGHGRDPADRRRYTPNHEGGRRALSVLRRVEVFAHAAVLECVLKTGRTHQIRMHARTLSHPILGDTMYGRRPRFKTVRDAVVGLTRHALHAGHLGFEHPDGRWLSFDAPLPLELERLLQHLRGPGSHGPGGHGVSPIKPLA